MTSRTRAVTLLRAKYSVLLRLIMGVGRHKLLDCAQVVATSVLLWVAIGADVAETPIRACPARMASTKPVRGKGENA